MANIIDILINAKWTGGGAVGKASSDLRQLGNSATKTSAEMAGLPTSTQKTGVNLGALTTKIFAVTAAFTGLAIITKKIGTEIREGAELEATIVRFDKLAESIGTTGNALREDLGIATRGLVSNMNAMKAATDFLALGLAKNTDEAIRLTNVASQLGFNMNQLVLTLTNQTTMRFDALGVSVDGFQAKVDALEKAGFDANEAFKLAFLEQAEEQIERVGGRIETTAGKIDVIGAAWQNVTDDIKLRATDTFDPIIDKFADMIIASKDATAAVQELEKAIDDLGKGQQTLEDLTRATIELKNAQWDAIRAVRNAINEVGPIGNLLDFSGSMITTRQALKELIGELAAGGETIEEQRVILERFGFETDDIGVSLDGMGISWVEVGNAIERVRLARITEEFAELDSKLIDVGRDFGQVVDPRASDEMIELAKKVKDIEFRELLEDVGLTNDEFIKLAFTLGGVQKAIDLLQESGSPFDRERRGAFEAQFAGVDAGTLQERTDLWLGFQSDLTDISVREGELREQAEADYEKRRTEIVNDFGARRAKEEANWQRQIARQDEQLRRNIEQVQEDSGDRQAELREDANRRLADLERDHLDRMREIIESADLQLADAASRLDAKAVAAIERGREESLNNEKQAYTKQREEINRELQERLEAEREAAEERIEEMKEFHEERQKQEEEDRQYRLQQEQLAHDERLREFDKEHQDRLDQIKKQARDEERQRDVQYQSERMQLGDHWRQRDTLERQWMNDILQAEASWWSQRMGLVGGGTASGVDTGGTPGVPPPSGGGDTGTGGNKPSRFWLEQQVISIVNPSSSDAAFTWYQWMKGRSDAELAAWIEGHSDIDVPGYALGTLSARGGLAMVGEMGPELVALPGGSQVFDSVTTQRMMSGISVENISISVLEAKRPGDTAREVRREMTRIFEELAR